MHCVRRAAALSSHSSSPYAFKLLDTRPSPLPFAQQARRPEPPPLITDADDVGFAAAGALASSAVIAEAVQIGGTAVLFYFAQQLTGASSPVEAVEAMIDFLQQLPGLQGYAIFAAVMVFLQVVPIAAAFVLTLSAGAIFGVVKGTATVLVCSTLSATISFAIARTYGRDRLMDAAQFRAIDSAFADSSFQTSLTLITLLRLSPVLPFAW
jgi:uncharacterized membrane protein YdjX (TVP38/TMEM64 family)